MMGAGNTAERGRGGFAPSSGPLQPSSQMEAPHSQRHRQNFKS